MLYIQNVFPNFAKNQNTDYYSYFFNPIRPLLVIKTDGRYLYSFIGTFEKVDFKNNLIFLIKKNLFIFHLFFMKKLLVSATLLFISFLQLNAQQIPQKVQRSKWVKIMANDSAYNFLEAQKEFQVFYTAYLKEQHKEQIRKERNTKSYWLS